MNSAKTAANTPRGTRRRSKTMAFEPVTIGEQTFNTVDELKAFVEKGTMRQSDYTKKQQELASLRAEVETQKAGLTDAEKVKELLVANPELAEELDKLLEKKRTGTAIQSAGAAAEIAALEKKLAEEIKKNAEETKSIKDRLLAEDNKKSLDYFMSTVDSNLKALGRSDVYDDPDKKEVVATAALQFAGKVYETTKEVASPEELTKFIKEKTEKIFGDKDLAAVIASEQKRKKIGDGAGAAGASEPKYVLRGDPNRQGLISGALEKLGFRGRT